MMAIGHYIYDKNINVNIVYTTAQQFVEDYFKSKNKNQEMKIKSIQTNNGNTIKG